MTNEKEIVNVSDCLTITPKQAVLNHKKLQKVFDLKVKKCAFGIPSINILLNDYSELSSIQARLNQAIEFTTIAMEAGEDELECMYTIQVLSKLISKLSLGAETDILDNILINN